MRVTALRAEMIDRTALVVVAIKAMPSIGYL